MKNINLLRNKFFWLQFVFAIVIIIIVVIITNVSLKKYTNHNKEFALSDFTQMNLEEVVDSEDGNNLDFVIIDSIYDPHLKSGIILQQDPQPESMVKPGRKVYVVLSALSPGKTKMPDLRDVTVRQAEGVLEAAGLKLGDISYAPTFDRNAVQEQLHNNRHIEPGTEIAKGSVIDIVVGAGFESINTTVPFIYGCTVKEARSLIMAASLNVGDEHFLDTQNFTDAIVYQYFPQWNVNETVEMGTKIELYYRSKLNISVDSLKFVMLFREEHRYDAGVMYNEQFSGIAFQDIDFESVVVNDERPKVSAYMLRQYNDNSTQSTDNNYDTEEEEDSNELF